MEIILLIELNLIY